MKRLFGIPVVVYSITRRKEDYMEMKRLGAVRFIVKPVKFSDICTEVKDVLVKMHKIVRVNIINLH